MANLTGSWLAFRLGVDPVRIERMRRAGELYAVRNDSGEWEYPGWQFDAAGELKPAVAEFLASARREKIAPAELTGAARPQGRPRRRQARARPAAQRDSVALGEAGDPVAERRLVGGVQRLWISDL